MAAVDLFEAFNASLSHNEQTTVQALLREKREALFAARSEEARLRSVNDYIASAHEMLKKAGSRS